MAQTDTPTRSPSERGSIGRLRRLPELDLESYHDFLTGLRSWMFKGLSAATQFRADDVVAAAQARGDNLSFPRAKALFEADQTLATSMRFWISAQLMAHKSLLDGFHRHGEAFLKEMDEAAASGPGSLELNPDLHIPEYARHEIHIQPGGYVGEDFAGHVYHYGTNSFYLGRNDQDEVYITRAARLAKPEDGKIQRIVDIGCGIGQYTVALKEAYPQAHVLGLEVGAPMLRYAHARAVKLGVDVDFAQRLAEDTGLEDGSVDVVCAHILFHEVSTPAAKDIIQEANRILRPGGVFEITDFSVQREWSTYMEYRVWADHYYNGEAWTKDYYNRDMLGLLRTAGFDVQVEDAPLAMGFLKKFVSVKPAQAGRVMAAA
jgi:ubiquinone/menaquinone biosynthesis C-methylase UbiE